MSVAIDDPYLFVLVWVMACDGKLHKFYYPHQDKQVWAVIDTADDMSCKIMHVLTCY